MDLIERQAAIDVLSLGKEILSRVLDDIDVVGTDREKYSWGLKLIESNIKDIEELPSAQPEMVKCKKCRYVYYDKEFVNYWCNRMSGSFKVEADGYCKWEK